LKVFSQQAHVMTTKRRCDLRCDIMKRWLRGDLIGDFLEIA
jgi:hypothetical protein